MCIHTTHACTQHTCTHTCTHAPHLCAHTTHVHTCTARVCTHTTHVCTGTKCVHRHTNSRAEARVRPRLTWPSCPEPRGSVITHTPQCRQPPARLHSALLVLTQADTPVAHGASRGSRSKPTATVVAANWLSVEPWVTARSAMADTFFPLVSGKALLSPLLRPQTAAEPHMPGHGGLARPASPADGGSRSSHSWESTEMAQRTGLAWGDVV